MTMKLAAGVAAAAVLALPHAVSAGTTDVSDPELTARAKLALMTAEGTPRGARGRTLAASTGVTRSPRPAVR